MASHDLSALRAPYSKAITLDGGSETVIPPAHTRAVAWRFKSVAGTAAMGGGDATDQDADTWMEETLVGDDAGPVSSTVALPIVWSGTSSQVLQLWFKKHTGGA